jgi:hypothetical protein
MDACVPHCTVHYRLAICMCVFYDWPRPGWPLKEREFGGCRVTGSGPRLLDTMKSDGLDSSVLCYVGGDSGKRSELFHFQQSLICRLSAKP